MNSQALEQAVIEGAIKEVSEKLMALIEEGAEFRKTTPILSDILAQWDVAVVNDGHFYQVVRLTGQAHLYSSRGYSTCLRWIVDHIIKPHSPKRVVIAE